MIIEPIFDRLIVEIVQAENVSEGGIVLSSNAQSMSFRIGHVLAAGPGRQDITMPVKEGDFVLLPESGGIPLRGVGIAADRVMFRIDEVLGVFYGAPDLIIGQRYSISQPLHMKIGGQERYALAAGSSVEVLSMKPMVGQDNWLVEVRYDPEDVVIGWIIVPSQTVQATSKLFQDAYLRGADLTK